MLQKRLLNRLLTSAMVWCPGSTTTIIRSMCVTHHRNCRTRKWILFVDTTGIKTIYSDPFHHFVSTYLVKYDIFTEKLTVGLLKMCIKIDIVLAQSCWCGLENVECPWPPCTLMLYQAIHKYVRIDFSSASRELCFTTFS